MIYMDKNMIYNWGIKLGNKVSLNYINLKIINLTRQIYTDKPSTFKYLKLVEYLSCIILVRYWCVV